MLSGSHPGPPVFKLLHTAGRGREAAVLLFPRGRWRGLCLGVQQRGYRMKRFTDRHTWGCQGIPKTKQKSRSESRATCVLVWHSFTEITTKGNAAWPCRMQKWFKVSRMYFSVVCHLHSCMRTGLTCPLCLWCRLSAG